MIVLILIEVMVMAVQYYGPYANMAIICIQNQILSVTRLDCNFVSNGSNLMFWISNKSCEFGDFRNAIDIEK